MKNRIQNYKMKVNKRKSKFLSNVLKILVSSFTIAQLFVLVCIILIVAFIFQLIAGLSAKQSSTLSSISVEGNDPEVTLVVNNEIYSSEYLRLVNKYVFDSHKKNEKVQYAPLDKVIQKLQTRNSSMEEVYLEVANDVSNEQNLIPFSLPINMKQAIKISSFWGQQRGNEYHSGWDISASAKTPVYAPANNGEVIKVSYPSVVNNGSWNGNTSLCYAMNNEIHIKYTFNDREYVVVFAHLYPHSNKVKVGDIVTMGQEIASVGTTGCSTGNHLHIELRLDNDYKKHTDFFRYADLNIQYK